MNLSIGPLAPSAGATSFAKSQGPAVLAWALCGFLGFAVGCGEAEQDAAKPAETAAAPVVKPLISEPTTPDDLPLALVRGLSAFAEREPDATGMPVPLAAELEFNVRRGGEWVQTNLTDPDSNVFHKALAYETPDGSMGLLTGGGTKAMIKLWKKEDGQLVSQTLWEKDFGGRFSRIRDIEVGDDGFIYLLLENKAGGKIVRLVPDDQAL